MLQIMPSKKSRMQDSSCEKLLVEQRYLSELSEVERRKRQVTPSLVPGNSCCSPLCSAGCQYKLLKAIWRVQGRDRMPSRSSAEARAQEAKQAGKKVWGCEVGSRRLIARIKYHEACHTGIEAWRYLSWHSNNKTADRSEAQGDKPEFG